jgi:hypothetical protein
VEELASPAGDGVAVQARDACQQSNSSAAVLLGEEADDEPSVALISAGDEPIDRLVFPGDGSVRFPAADRAGTMMDSLSLVRIGLWHRPLPP